MNKTLDETQTFVQGGDVIDVLIGGSPDNPYIRPYTEYTFGVFAVNLAGAGDEAMTDDIQTLEAGALDGECMQCVSLYDTRVIRE